MACTHGALNTLRRPRHCGRLTMCARVGPLHRSCFGLPAAASKWAPNPGRGEARLKVALLDKSRP
eukprot:15458003-Alexandrium_andersonii.AAC.1